jgi:uncharacterized membrane protein
MIDLSMRKRPLARVLRAGDTVRKLMRFLRSLDAHQRVLIAIAVGIVAFLAAAALHRLALEVILAWNAFALTVILLCWIRIVFTDVRTVSRSAKLQDAGRTAIFLFVICAACTSLFAVAFLLGTAKGLHGNALTGHVLLAGGTVVCSWCLVHTVFAMHYAHAYYRRPQTIEGVIKGSGLEFPGKHEPDFLDFAYFSFVIGMTFQVSDVQITSRQLRRLALVHGILSFAFNTVILAFAINLLSGLSGS